ncbi:MAG TPA: serine acetyltransferase, partial [Desulfomonilia bacterium]|nr:serine acetyltransferase [Desulfomonilia bacterium]
YSGTTILGRVRIGRGSVIGGNVWLDHDVAPLTTVLQSESSNNIIVCTSASG